MWFDAVWTKALKYGCLVHSFYLWDVSESMCQKTNNLNQRISAF